MKKILSMLLAVLMLFSLCAMPAFAEEVPVYEQFGYASEEEFMEYEVDWMSWRDIPYEWVCEQFDLKYQEILSNPQIAHDYWGYDEAMLEEEIANGTWLSVDDYYRRSALVIVQGNLWLYVPPVSVQLDGETVNFPDAAPEITDGRTMVPFRAIAEEMGFTVSFDNGAIIGSDGETSVAFTVGETACVITKSSGEETVTMDTAPYIKEDRTYVPVRFFAEAMGMTVAWDGEYQVAVIYDKEAWIQKMDEDFTIYNSLLKMNPETAETPEDFQMILSMGMTITQISSLDGNTEYPMEFEATFIKEGNKVQSTMLLDLFEIFKLTAAESGLTAEDMEAALMGMENYLKDIKAELIVNMDEEKLYIHCPAINYILSMEGELQIADADSTWLSVELPDMGEVTAGLDDLLGSIPTVESMGDIIMYLKTPENSFEPSKGLEEMMEVKRIVGMIIGDSVFTQKGNEYTAAWDYSMEELAPEDAYIEGGYWKGTMAFNVKNSEVDFDMEVRVNDSYEGDTLINIRLSGNDEDLTMAMTVHVENEMIVELEIDAKMTDVKKSPMSEPPKGAVIFDMNEMEL